MLRGVTVIGWLPPPALSPSLRREGPRSRCYGRTTALRLFVQPYDEHEDEQFFFTKFYT
jgi:hypothetical protein